MDNQTVVDRISLKLKYLRATGVWLKIGDMKHASESIAIGPLVENYDPEPDDLELEIDPGCLRCGNDLSKAERREGRKFCSDCVE